MSADPVLEAALAWHRLGAGIVPLVDRGPNELVPAIRWQEEGPLLGEAEICRYWAAHPDAQLAITLDNSAWGGPRLCCVDDDSGKHPATRERPRPLGYVERTRSGGRHNVFQYRAELPPDAPSRVTEIDGFVDILCGGILYVAPTANRGIGAYVALTPLNCGIPVYDSVGIGLDSASSWLRGAWREKALEGGFGHGGAVGRDAAACFAVGVRARAAGASPRQVQEAVKCPHPEWDDAHIDRTVARIDRYLARTSREPIEAPAKRKLPTGDEIAWSVPGEGERTDESCGTITHYAHTAPDGRKHYRTAPHSCNRRDCPVCFGRTAHREGRVAERQVYSQVHRGAEAPADGALPPAEKWSRRPYLVSLHPPAGTIGRLVSVGEYTEEIRPAVYRKLRRHGVTGGALVLHMVPEPVFHSLVFIRGTHPQPSGPDPDGWTVTLRPVRGPVYAVLRWMHARAAVPYTASEVTLAEGPRDEGSGEGVSSAKVTPRCHSMTWFGSLAYAAREPTEAVPVGFQCEVCSEIVAFGLWVRQIWVGKGPPPRGHGVCIEGEWVDDPLADVEWSYHRGVEERVPGHRWKGRAFDRVAYEEAYRGEERGE